jgi:hypothetical protein
MDTMVGKAVTRATSKSLDGSATEKAGDDLFATLRTGIAPLVEVHAEEIRRSLCVQKLCADAKREIGEAIVLAVAWENLNPAPRRYSDIRKEQERLAKEARAACESLSQTLAAFDSLPPLFRHAMSLAWSGRGDVVRTVVEREVIPWLGVVKDLAEKSAGSLMGIDRGGRRSYDGFGLLIDGLARAFLFASRRKPTVTKRTYGSDPWGGKFLQFVKTIFPIANRLSEQVGKPFAHPTTDSAWGEFIYQRIHKMRARATSAVGETAAGKPDIPTA